MRLSQNMFTRLTAFTASFTLVLLLAGCATDTSIPDDLAYVPPASGDVATIKGTYNEDTGLFAAKHTGFVLMVDRKFVKNPEQSWNQPLALSPGTREIACEYHQSVFKARATFKLEVLPGVNYQIRISPGTEGDAEQRFCDFSIINTATGKPVTPIKHVTVSESSNRSNFRPLD